MTPAPDPPAPCATAAEALAFVETHGVVLVSAKGSAPKLVDAIVGHRIDGSWWSHPEGRRIFAILSAVTESEQVLVCRLLGGKITLVHRRLWPALARMADRLAPEQIAQVRQEHTPSGRHVNHEIPFPRWVPVAVLDEAAALGAEEALSALAAWWPAAAAPVEKTRHREASA
jgi:hypothetical protein